MTIISERKPFTTPYTANPLSCAAALASLEAFEEERTLQRIREIIPCLKEGIRRLKNLPYVGDVRSLGMIGAIEIVKDKRSKTIFDFKERIGYKIYVEGLKRGLLLRPWENVIYLFPPLCIKNKELAHILESCYSIVKDIRL